MYQVNFYSFLKNIVGSYSVEIPNEIITINELITHLCTNYSGLQDYLGDNPEVSMSMGSTTLLLPNDLSKNIIADISISPIISGG
ncbi:MAG: hypothetical protein OEY49_10055 [Candidatus Heimdallarchaeota archaeon]|nr:hypothetical protein [Candidatus Heimdallarchaeota archaeon]